MKTSAKKNKRIASGSRSRVAKKGASSLRKPISKKPQRIKKASKPIARKQEESGDDQMKKYFNDLLKDTLNAEKQMVRALPRMAKACTSKSLRKAFEKHLGETEKHVTRLEKVFIACGFKITSKKCEAMEGLVKEGVEAIHETTKGSLVRDVALIVAAQKVEHYEIASYGSLRSIAMILGFDKAVELLQKTLDEEGAADKKLTEISDSLNPKASASKPEAQKTTASAESKNISEEADAEVEEAVYLDADEEEEGEGEGSPSGNASGNFGNSL